MTDRAVRGGQLYRVNALPGEGTKLSLRPQLHRVPRHELQPGVCLDAIDGVSLRALPDRLAT